MRLPRSLVAALAVALVGLAAAARAHAYPWPVKPFDEPHPIRGAFDDPRFHLDAEGELSAFHFGVDIAVPDGTPVYAVEPGYVRARESDVTVRRTNGRAFSYWHVAPVVHTGEHVHAHQLLGYVRPGWGHVHFAESYHGAYRNPLRRGALTPFRDRTPPTVDSIALAGTDGSNVAASRAHGLIDIEAEVYDTPPLPPSAPWQNARLTPALVWWRLEGPTAAATPWTLAVDFDFGLMPSLLYNWVYAPGTYQNKPNRPGRYLFWLDHGFDTTTVPDGSYRLDVLAEDTRGNSGSASIEITIANGAPPAAPGLARGRSGPRRPA